MSGYYDNDRAMYIFPNGAAIPVATAGPFDRLEHLAHPGLFMTGVRVAVCNQGIELNWMTVMMVQDTKPAPPNPLCTECVTTVENVFNG